LAKKKKSKRKKLLYWLLIDLVVFGVVIGSLLHKPAGYNPLVRSADSDSDEVHPYIHRDLASTLYNGAQSQKPFDLEVIDSALNEAIALVKWPQASGGVTFFAPEVLFQPDTIVLRGTTSIEGAELVVTIELGPTLSDDGLLSLNVQKVKIGAMNITPLAKMIARREYQNRLETVPVDTDDIRTKIAASLLIDEPFEPVFKVEDKWVRLQKISLVQGKLTAHFVPAELTTSR